MSQQHLADRRSRPQNTLLSGVRIADFCWVGVGALATRLLADFGAEVIKIEDGKRLDLTRRMPIYNKQKASAAGLERPDLDANASGMFTNYNRNKLGVTIDMRTKKGQALAEQLIAKSNVVTENFAPGVMERWGLTYERIRELCPDVIYARMSGFGHSGPYEGFRSYGPVVQAVSGLSYISGLPGMPPSGWGLSYMDNQAAYYNSNALLTAIYHRMLTGEGCEIDVSAVEAGVTLVGPLMLDVSVNGYTTDSGDFPTGNRLPYENAAPHGVYPAQGEDLWIAIAVFNDEEWQALLTVMGNPGWASEKQFSSQQARYENQDALDEYMSAWTKDFDRHDLMHKLQKAGVRAAAVQCPEDLIDKDPQLRAREVHFKMDHPVVGEAIYEGAPITSSRQLKANWRSGPLLGEDNEYVFKDILGLSEDEIGELKEEGVI